MDPIQRVFSIPELKKIIQDYAYEPIHYHVWEGDDVTIHDCLKKAVLQIFYIMLVIIN